MFNKRNYNNNEIMEITKERDSLKKELESQKRLKTIKQNYCTTCIHGVSYWNGCKYEYLCELDNKCSDYVKVKTATTTTITETYNNIEK